MISHLHKYDFVNSPQTASVTTCRVCDKRVFVFVIHFLIYCLFTLMLTRIHPNLKSKVYCYAIAFGGAEEWDFAWRMFTNATLASEASSLRTAMACTKVPWLLNRYV